VRRMEKIHLWVGLITSIIILLESVTGLMLEEPEWFGGNSQTERHFNPENFRGNFNPGNMDSGQGHTSGETNNGQVNNGQANNNQAGFRNRLYGQFPRRDIGGMGSLRQIVEQLHRGVINGVDVHWIMDVVAIGLIFLSTSGIYMSIRILTAQKKQKEITRYIKDVTRD